MNLGDAAEGVRILYLRLRLLLKRALLKEITHLARHLCLSGMRTNLMELRNEWRLQSVKSLQRDGPDRCGSVESATTHDEGIHGMGAHELSTIEQRQTLLALEGNGLDAGVLKGLV